VVLLKTSNEDKTSNMIIW